MARQHIWIFAWFGLTPGPVHFFGPASAAPSPSSPASSTSGASSATELDAGGGGSPASTTGGGFFGQPMTNTGKASANVKKITARRTGEHVIGVSSVLRLRRVQGSPADGLLLLEEALDGLDLGDGLPGLVHDLATPPFTNGVGRPLQGPGHVAG